MEEATQDIQNGLGNDPITEVVECADTTGYKSRKAGPSKLDCAEFQHFT